jgi:D-3-phosphoglycerate dehydrogenase
MKKPGLKILIGEPENYSPKAISIYRKLGKVLIPKSDRELGKFLPQADVLVIRLGIRADKKLLDKAPNLKAIAANTTGLNHIDLGETQKRKIAVISLRGQTDFLKNVHATPELTFTLVLSLIRKIPWAFDDVKKGRWNRTKYLGNELFGKTIGLLGLGRVGKIVAGYARAFGMKVVAADPAVSAGNMKKVGAKKVSPDKLFKISDIVSVHALYSPGIGEIVKERHLKLMKSSAVFINTARGELTDEAALLKALKKEWIAGAALDVLREENLERKDFGKNSLISYAKRNENLIIVPHIGGATAEAWRMTEDYLAEQVLKQFKK